MDVDGSRVRPPSSLGLFANASCARARIEDACLACEPKYRVPEQGRRSFVLLHTLRPSTRLTLALSARLQLVAYVYQLIDGEVKVDKIEWSKPPK